MVAKREKKPIHKVQLTEGKRQIIQKLLQEYDIEYRIPQKTSRLREYSCGVSCTCPV